ncbi:16S rRNA (guanine(966)-N(2))-methyltransferase RsmD [Gimesia benthica]|uniref:16S rRNA (Guanine(966)-N(2))-methyltransferase RsmD n=1 Tax=Gimesia benthica TaxID=2608982 RepID=A0A6I6AC89_9PLAN|nr:16S rRNA (guanine(966)-N(2))-methyltransferase RsmD [Gimesia benthica]QGQ23212.1 16S rRNA (guanine(966)-N(2))-methyltransferase RsmD [Gimesia benthica]
MRIIAGKYRRRKLQANPGQTTRPITDFVKEVLFEWLGDSVKDKRVADIYAGTGSLGLEALSRGATSAVFIEQDWKAHELLKQNVAHVGVEADSLCWKTNALLSSFRPKNVPDFVPFDLIFFDPPYKMIDDLKPGSRLYESMQRLARDNVSSPDCRLLLRTPRDAEFEAPPEWQQYDLLQKSSMDIYFLKKQEPSA